MARRRNSDTSTFATIILLFAVAVLGPLALLLFWVKAEWDARQLPEGADYYLSALPDEVAEMEASALGAQISRDEVAAMFAEGSADQLEKRSDGLFDGRSNGAST